MELCKKLGLDEDTYSILHSSRSNDQHGWCCYYNLRYGIIYRTYTGNPCRFSYIDHFCVLAALSAAGASGVAGGSLLLILMACSLFGVPNDVAMQAVGVGFIIGVIQDSCETGLNSSSDVLYTAIADIREKRLYDQK